MKNAHHLKSIGISVSPFILPLNLLFLLVAAQQACALFAKANIT